MRGSDAVQIQHGKAAAMTIFLDRDGTINRKRPEGDYVKSWDEFEFLPGALAGLRRIAADTKGRVICVTNQRGIARNRMTEDALTDIHKRMVQAVHEAGGRIDAIYYCPHESGCDCRKPLTGLFQRACRDFPDIVLNDSLIVGDAISDMLPASKLGCGAALVAAPPAAARILERAEDQGIRVDFCVESLLELAELLPGWKPRGISS